MKYFKKGSVRRGASVFSKIRSLTISRCCFADDGEEVKIDLYRAHKSHKSKNFFCQILVTYGSRYRWALSSSFVDVNTFWPLISHSSHCAQSQVFVVFSGETRYSYMKFVTIITVPGSIQEFTVREGENKRLITRTGLPYNPGGLVGILLVALCQTKPGVTFLGSICLISNTCKMIYNFHSNHLIFLFRNIG